MESTGKEGRFQAEEGRHAKKIFLGELGESKSR